MSRAARAVPKLAAIGLLLGALAFAARAALAQDVDTPLYLQVFVNGRDSELIIEVVQMEDRLITPRSELAAVGIETEDLPAGRVDLGKVPGLGWRYDLPTQSLWLTARPDRIAAARLSPRRSDTPEADRSFGAAMNYDLNVRFGDRPRGGPGLTGATVGIDAWAFLGPARLGTTGLAILPVAEGSERGWRRYETGLTFDLPRRATSLRLGDTVTSSLSWGRAVRIGGARLARDFALRRDLVRAPLPSFEGSVAVPSAVDIFVEGNRVFSDRLEEGRFRIDDIPVITGAGTAVVSVRGVDGTITRTELPFYGTRGLLARGLTDWSVEMGYPRLAFGIENDSYGDDLVWNGTLRRGLTDRLTLELQAAGTRDFRHAAIGFGTVLLRSAELRVTLGASELDGRRGRFHDIGLSMRPFGRLRLEANRFRASDGYADLAFAIDTRTGGAARGTERARDLVSLSLPARDGGFGLGIGHVRIARDGSRAELTSFGLSKALPGLNAMLNVNGTHDWRGGDTRVALSMTFRLGKRTVQATSTTQGGSGVLLSRPGDGALGSVGYELEANRRGGRGRVAAHAWSERRFGRVDLRAQRANGRSSVDLRLQGAFAVMDRRVTAGRRIDGSFAVVDLGRPGLPVRLQNREVAWTGRSGRALVSGLQPHARNRVSVDVDDIPSDATWSSTATDVVPARRSGVHVPFGLSDLSTTTLVRLEDAAGRPLPPGTPVAVDGRAHPLGTGYDGLLLLTDPRLGAALTTAGCRAVVPAPRADGAPAVATCR